MQLGINGAVAQQHVNELLAMERDLLAQGKAPTHRSTVDWLNALADRYESAPANYAEDRGLSIIDCETLIMLEGTRDENC